GSDRAAELVLDVDPNDLLEVRLRLEPERECTLRIEAARPARDHTCERLVGLATDALHDVLAGDATQRPNLPADRLGNTGHRQAAAAVERTALERRGMDKEADCRSRRREPVTYRLGHGQHCSLSVQRLADDAREEARGSQIGLAGSNADRRQPDRDSV